MMLDRKSYGDYKYIMLDTSYLYVGSRFTYTELMEEEDVPFKFKSILERYLLPEVEGNTSLESHFYYMKKGDFSERTYQQLRTKIKVSILVNKKSFFTKKERKEFMTKTFALKDFIAMSKEEKEKEGILIQEIVISKMALLSFAL